MATRPKSPLAVREGKDQQKGGAWSHAVHCARGLQVRVLSFPPAAFPSLKKKLPVDAASPHPASLSEAESSHAHPGSPEEFADTRGVILGG